MQSTLEVMTQRARAEVALAVRAAGLTPDTVGAGAGPGMAGSAYQQPTVENAAEQLRHFNGRVYAAVRPIANRVAQQPYRIAKVVGAAQKPAVKFDKRCLPHIYKAHAQELEELKTHPILDTLADPNRLMTAWTLKSVGIIQLLLTGRCYWWLVPPVSGKPAPRRAGREKDYNQHWQIWPLPASWVQPVHEANLPFARWKIQPYGGTKSWDVPLEEIVYFYLPDPADPLRSHSPLQANARAVISHEAINEAQRRTFHRQFPGLMVTIGRHPDAKDVGVPGQRPPLSGQQRAQIVQWVEAMYSGMENFNKPLIIDSLIEKVEQLSKSPREFDFMKSNDSTMAQIDEGFGTNPVIMGRVENLSRASSAVADDHFCFPGDVAVTTSAGVKPISEIRAGDEVVTHRGRWRPVTGVMQRPFSGDLVVINAGGNMPLRTTGNHPLWVRPGSAQGCSRALLHKESGSDQRVPCARIGPGAPRWIPAEEVKVGDFMLLPRMTEPVEPVIVPSEWITIRTVAPGRVKVAGNKTKKSIPSSIVVSDEMAFALGLYLAEGHCSTGGVVWTLNARTEMHLKQRLDGALVGVCESLKTQMNGGGVQFYQYNATLKALLLAMFGKGAAGKRVPACVFSWPDAQRRMFAAGYLSGDGSKNSVRSVQFSSVSESVARGVRHLLATLGVACTVSRYVNKPRGLIQGRVWNRRQYTWKGMIGGADARRVAEWMGKEIASPTQRPHVAPQSVCDDAGVWFRVREVGRESFSGDVFNFSVAEDESYCTSAGAVHNCRNTVNPIIAMMGECMTAWMVPLMAPDEEIVIFQEPAQSDDVDHDLAEANAIVLAGCGLMSEVRDRFHLPFLEGTDQLLLTPRGPLPWTGDPEEFTPVDPLADPAADPSADPSAEETDSDDETAEPPDPAENEQPAKQYPLTSARRALNRRGTHRLKAGEVAASSDSGQPVNVTVVFPEHAFQVALSLPTQPAPIVNVEAAAPIVNVQLPEHPLPQVTVNLPELAPTITFAPAISLPEQAPPTINVSAAPPLIEVKVALPEQPVPQVTVNVPEQPAAQITVSPSFVLPEQPAPVITVNVPHVAEDKIIERDGNGNIVRVRTVPVPRQE